MNAYDAVVLIPSLEPDERLPRYVRELLERGFHNVLIVNDGSSEQYDPIFDSMKELQGCTVIGYRVNKGKGAALKTGYQYIKEHIPSTGVVTADADGQHTVNDIEMLGKKLAEGTKGLLLGSRDFNLPNIPQKSRTGNKITSSIFHVLYGKKLPDTQTGLRAFGKDLLDFMIDIPGERFEYEMNVLMQCSMKKVPMIPVSIETVYENGENKGTHFHPIRDSWRIYKLLLSNFFRFMSASIICMLLDNGLFYLFSRLFWAWMPEAIQFLTIGNFFNMTLQILLATAVARVISAAVNFVMNKKLVFDIKKCPGAVWRYIALCVCVLLISSLFVSILNEVFSLSQSDSFVRTLLKMPVDLILFFFNYRIQRSWVFASKNKGEKNK